MKPIIAAAIIALPANSAPAADLPTHPEMKILQNMRLSVKKDELAGFLVRAKAESWQAPHLYSAYWVEKLPLDQIERAKLETERRRFGAALAEALDEAALKLVKPATSVQRETQVEQMLSVARWIRTERGYGNLLLFNRAQNLAAIPFAHLIADLDYPLARVEVLKPRFSSESDDLEFRVAVLNEEGPTPYVVTNASSPDDRLEGLERFWNRNWSKMKGWAETNKIRGKSIGHSFRSQLSPEFAFYCDDEDSPEGKPRTPAGLWDMKRHLSVCVFGNRDRIILDAELLLLVRQELGDFPTTPPSWYKTGDNWTPTQAAFEKAWQAHEKRPSNIALAAARTYEVVKANRFMDWETSELLKNK